MARASKSPESLEEAKSQHIYENKSDERSLSIDIDIFNNSSITTGSRTTTSKKSKKPHQHTAIKSREKDLPPAKRLRKRSFTLKSPAADSTASYGSSRWKERTVAVTEDQPALRASPGDLAFITKHKLRHVYQFVNNSTRNYLERPLEPTDKNYISVPVPNIHAALIRMNVDYCLNWIDDISIELVEDIIVGRFFRTMRSPGSAKIQLEVPWVIIDAEQRTPFEQAIHVLTKQFGRELEHVNLLQVELEMMAREQELLSTENISEPDAFKEFFNSTFVATVDKMLRQRETDAPSPLTVTNDCVSKASNTAAPELEKQIEGESETKCWYHDGEVEETHFARETALEKRGVRPAPM